MPPLNLRLILAFFAIYVVWGSTYLAIKLAVGTIPPLATAGVRQLVAGLILFVWARAWRKRITAVEWRASVVGGSRWSARIGVGLAAGLIGVGLLVPRDAFVADSQQVWGLSAILLGAMSWALSVAARQRSWRRTPTSIP